MAENLNHDQSPLGRPGMPRGEEVRQITARLQELLEHLEAVEAGRAGLVQLSAELAGETAAHASAVERASIRRLADRALQQRVAQITAVEPQLVNSTIEVEGNETAARAVAASRSACAAVQRVGVAVNSPAGAAELRPTARELSPAPLIALGLKTEIRQDAGIHARQVLEDLDQAIQDHRNAVGENTTPFDRKLWASADQIREVSHQVHVPLMDEPLLEGEIAGQEHQALGDLIRRAEGLALGPPDPIEAERLRRDLDLLAVKTVERPATAIENPDARFSVPAPSGLPHEAWGHDLYGTLDSAEPGRGMDRHIVEGQFMPGSWWYTEHVIVAQAPADWTERWPSPGIQPGDVVVGRYIAGACEEIQVHRADRRFLAETPELSDPEPEALLRGYGVEAPLAIGSQIQRLGLSPLAIDTPDKTAVNGRDLSPFEHRYGIGIEPAEPGIEITGP